MKPKLTPTLAVTYEVREHPQQRGRWIVLRGGKPTGGYGDTIHMALNSAIGEAKQEARTSEIKVKVMFEGKPEWESHTPD